MTTKLAIPHWQGRVSPVFDVARSLLVVGLEQGIEQDRREVALTMTTPQARVARLVEEKINVLICGAISWPLETAIAAAGIEVIPQTCGGLEQVLAAFAAGKLHQGAFRMPGCCGRLRARGHRRCGRR